MYCLRLNIYSNENSSQDEAAGWLRWPRKRRSPPTRGVRSCYDAPNHACYVTRASLIFPRVAWARLAVPASECLHARSAASAAVPAVTACSPGCTGAGPRGSSADGGAPHGLRSRSTISLVWRLSGAKTDGPDSQAPSTARAAYVRTPQCRWIM
jgi:hypothetical protein